MAVYRYALRHGAGPNEHLGFIEIPSDQEAIDFGREVIVSILRDPGVEGATLEITERMRTVDSVSLALELLPKAYG